jgi:hypothetical protein
VTEVQHEGRAPGWREDPFGRHELRFFDGTRWTPYVRDDGRDGMDEPGGPVGAEARQARSSLLTEDLLVVERFSEPGHRWSDRSVLRRDGAHVATLRRVVPVENQTGGLRALVARDRVKSDVVEVVDDRQQVVLTLLRPARGPESAVEVRDRDGRDAGRIVQQTLDRQGTTYSLVGPNGRFLGELRAEDWVAWDIRAVDSHARQVATVTRDWTGLEAGTFPRFDDYVVRITDSLDESLRVMVVACTLSLEVMVRPDGREP